MSKNALDGVTVVELGSGFATAYCGKLLADLGARTILVEPPGGHPLRRQGPSKSGASHSGLFAHFGTNKQSLVVDSASIASRRTLLRLCADADIVIGDGTTDAERLLVGPLSDRLIRVDLSPFGRSGRYQGWRASDIATWALGGYMYFSGEKTREPLLLPGDQAELHAGMHGALAALAALREQRASGFGQAIEVSSVEATLAAHNWLTTMWSHGGIVQDRTTQDLIRCADGWVSFMQLVRYPNLFLLMDRPDLLDEPKYADVRGWAVHNREIYGLVAEWCAERRREEIISSAQELRIACAPANDVGDLAASKQLAARNWWVDVDDGALGRIRLPGFPYNLSETPARIATPAPALGAHSEALSDEFRAASPGESPARAAPAGAGPLAGLRVLEVTNNWAGPVCCRHLGDLGADIIKVESPTRPATRGGVWPKADPQRQPYNRSGYFNEMNRNKRDIVLDLADPDGKRVFLELVKHADAVVENNSARVMPNLGLSYDDLKQTNPAIIMVSISGSGASGPERDYLAYGSNIEASSGLASLLGYDDSEPYRTSSYYADPLAGGHAAIALLAALEYRRRTGKGQWIELSLNEVAPGFFPAALIGYQLNGEIPHRTGNRDRRYAPQGAYRCAGIDNWLALSVQDDERWQQLCRVIRREDLAADESLASLPGRQARHDEIDTAIGAWASTREQYEAAWELQRAGVSAAPVLASWQFLSDPHLFERGFFVHIEHPVVGVYPYTGWPWRLSRTPAAVYRPAPLFGEHNDAVFAAAGIDAGTIRTLYERQVTATEPLLG